MKWHLKESNALWVTATEWLKSGAKKNSKIWYFFSSKLLYTKLGQNNATIKSKILFSMLQFDRSMFYIVENGKTDSFSA